MYCKDCGNIIDDDSKFCRFCGATQLVSSSENHQTQKLKQVEVYGNISANVAPTFPNLTNFVAAHKKLVISYALWFLIQIVFLLAGNDGDGFWPRVSQVGGYYTGPIFGYGSRHYVEKSIEWDWSLYSYGLSEFVIYAFIVPLLLYIICMLFKKYKVLMKLKSFKHKYWDLLKERMMTLLICHLFNVGI